MNRLAIVALLLTTASACGSTTYVYVVRCQDGEAAERAADAETPLVVQSSVPLGLGNVVDQTVHLDFGSTECASHPDADACLEARSCAWTASDGCVGVESRPAP